MKLLILLLCCLLLCGCETAAPLQQETPPQKPEAAAPAVVEVPLKVLTPVDLVVVEPPQWRGSEPQEGEPVTPQPGDTAETWDISQAKAFPANGDCTPQELLDKWLAVEGLTASDLEDRDCSQLVLAAADGVTTRTVCYSRQDDGTWTAEPGMTDMAGFVGRNGIAHDRRRGTETSPAGLWPLGSAFGLMEAPADLRVPWRDITPRSDWVTDSRSLYFNTWQEQDDPDLLDDWSSAEHLADYDETYTYACVIEYNTPPYTVPNRGCAIFLHVSDHPTEGCVGLLTDDMVRVLQWLDPCKNPHILITGYQK